MAVERCVQGRFWFNNRPTFIVFKYLGSRSFDSGIHCAVLQTCLKVVLQKSCKVLLRNGILI